MEEEGKLPGGPLNNAEVVPEVPVPQFGVTVLWPALVAVWATGSLELLGITPCGGSNTVGVGDGSPDVSAPILDQTLRYL
jgi:hypothetical protein